MIHPQGFAADPAFQLAGHSAIDTARAVLRRQQPGRDLRRLADRGRAGLRRAGARRAGHELLDAAAALVDFDQYATVLYPRATRDEIERPLLFSLIQQLWDRAEPNGYAQHMTSDPYAEHAGARGPAAPGGRRPPGRQRGRRGRGAHDRRAVLRSPVGRAAPDRAPFFGIPPIGAFPFDGPRSFYEPWDAGAAFNSLAPNANPSCRPPRRATRTRTASRAAPRPPRNCSRSQITCGSTAPRSTDRCGGGPCHSLP